MTSSDPLLTLGFAGVDWIEHYLVHGPGDVQGQPIELDDEFAAFVVKAYRVNKVGQRVVRRAFLSRPKGRSKSGLAAMIACFEALGPCRFDHFAEPGEVSAWGYQYEPGEPVGRPLTYVEVLNVATEEGQAGNTYDAVYYMLNPETCSQQLLDDYGKVDVGLTRTVLPQRRGFIEPVTSADSSKDGGKSTFIVADETHLWVLPRLKRLHGVMTRNLLKRKEASGWMLETSTMYGEGEGSVAEGTHAYAKAVRSGKRVDRTLLFDHRQASTEWDLAKRASRLKALREAYGPAVDWMNLDAICDSWDDPQVSEGEFRRYWLNQPVPMMDLPATVIPMPSWAGCADLDSEIIGEPAFALDIDPDQAASAIAVAGMNACGPAGADGNPTPPRFHVEVTVREGVVDHRPGTDWVVPRVKQLAEKYPNMKLHVAGSSGVKFLIPELERLVEVVQLKTEDMAAACGVFYNLATSDPPGMAHFGQEDLTTALRNAKKRVEDGETAWTWGRKRSIGDITPLYAATVALWAAHQEQTADYDVLESAY